jgi:tetratricopeptide (TPR) repeat protein
MHIDSVEKAERIQLQAFEMLETGRASDAVELAEQISGIEPSATSLQALIFTEAGELLKNSAVLLRGRDAWDSLGPERSSTVAYNLANAELGLWTIAADGHNYADALQGAREHLLAARELYGRVGADESCSDEIRVQALTNLGNSYDNLGREIEAYECWRKATDIDPDFGMAHGNVGVALAHVAGHLNQHAPTALNSAATALDKALADRDRVLRYGGPRALQHFEKVRGDLPKDPKHAEEAGGPWADRYLEWCRRNQLFLHLSPSCQRESDEHLDPLYVRGISSALNDDDQERIKNVFDAFNVTKQDFLAARYSTWLAVDTESPIYGHARAVSARSTFLDTLEYGRWGVRTGMATAAFAAAINVLDKIASYIHLYFDTARKQTDVYFRSLWHPRSKNNTMDPELIEAISLPRGNRGLLALCDLACELERDTPLTTLVNQRHTATHRFLIAHSLPPMIEPVPRLDRVEWHILVEQSIELLRVVRASIIYMARTIDINEALNARDDAEKGAIRGPMHLPRVDPNLTEID